MNLKITSLAVVSAILATPLFGDVYWTGGSESSSKYWDDPANWNGNEGNYVIRTAEMKDAPTEVNFWTAASISTGFWIENSLDGIVTFNRRAVPVYERKCRGREFGVDICVGAELRSPGCFTAQQSRRKAAKPSRGKCGIISA